MRSYLFIFIFSSFFFASCDNGSSKEQVLNEEVTKSVKKYGLSAFGQSQAYPDATIKSYSYKNGKFDFDVSGTNYSLGQQTPDAPSKMCANSSKGQHIHLIVDNAPYAAKYTSEFEYDMPSGAHYLLAFLSRSYHESIKTNQAHTAQKINVVDNTIVDQVDITEPMLFYSRPKGTYIGNDTKKVMLDFYPVNVALGSTYKVKAEINGEEYILDKWQPYYLEGLPMGENSITLTLIDGDGKTVDTPLNPVTRKFTLLENIDPEN